MCCRRCCRCMGTHIRSCRRVGVADQDQDILLGGDLQTGVPPQGTGEVMATTSSLTRAHIPPGSQDQSYDYRYEFSETRKVLEEFFKAENEFPASSSPPMGLQQGGPGLQPHNPQSIHTAYRTPQGANDLDYSLKRHAGNSYVGSRLADADDDIVSAVISKQQSEQQPGILRQ